MTFIDWIAKFGRQVKGNAEPKHKGKRICATCKGVIDTSKGFTKQQGLYFHRACWKMEKAASRS